VEESTAFDDPRGLRAGSRFGHYRLRRSLGKGGFGQVWEAEDTVMDRVVALKLLRPEYSQNEKFRQRLFREARAAGRLNEHHVVPIHHCGEIGGQLYIDMRLIDGTDLEAVLAQEGPLSPARAVAVVRQIAAALDAAHAAQMIHRDVKPANILLAEDDFACLLDFGLANAATDAKLTSTGFTIGTWEYMAPERFSDGEVDHRADIYALACVLYECLTGSLPYTMSDRFELIAAHGTAPIPRPSQHGSAIPAGFDDVISCGMAKNPADRYASAGDLARAALRALSTRDQAQAETIAASAQVATESQSSERQRADSTMLDWTPPFPEETLVDEATSSSAASKPPDLPSQSVGQWANKIAQQPAQLASTQPTAAPKTAPPRPTTARLGRFFSGWEDWEVALIAVLVVILIVAVVIGILVVVGYHRRSYSSQVELPFTGLAGPFGVAVGGAGDVYVADSGNNRVVKLAQASGVQTVLPFTGLNDSHDVAVDTAGNV
jgi:serine/threonine protein kinase, bacterial